MSKEEVKAMKEAELQEAINPIRKIIDFERLRGDLTQCEVYALKAERDDLKNKLVNAEAREQSLADSLADQAREIPRVITAGELREGQQVAIKLKDDSWFAGVVKGEARVISDGNEATGPASGLNGYTIVLLADAPPQEPEPVTAEDSPKPLTVEDLDAAEVGSKVTFSGSWLTKNDDGTWMGVKAEDVISMNPDRTLTPPEPARRGRVVKPEELREEDVCDLHYKQVSYTDQKVQSVCPDYVDFPTRRIDIPDTLGGLEIRLISRKPPEPEEHPVIQIYRSSFDFEGHNKIAVWSDRTGRYDMPHYALNPDQIEDWVALVPAGQEV